MLFFRHQHLPLDQVVGRAAGLLLVGPWVEGDPVMVPARRQRDNDFLRIRPQVEAWPPLSRLSRAGSAPRFFYATPTDSFQVSFAWARLHFPDRLNVQSFFGSLIRTVILEDEMINWWPVLAYGLWLFGLALLLASLGYSLWLTRQEGTGWRQQLRRPQFLRPFWLSLALVAIGLIGVSGQTWERLLWLFVSLYCLTNLWRLRRA